MSTHRLVVVGASLAGLRAVEGARRAGFDGPVTLLGAEEHLPYDRPPLSKAFLDADEPPDTTYRSHDQLSELGVDLRLGVPAAALDTAARVVVAGGHEIPYDGLVIATGAKARTLPGVEGLRGVHTLRTVDDARAVRSALEAGARVVVIGGGFIGSEVASGARKRGLDVVIIEALPTPLVRAVGEAMGAACTSLHQRHGVDVRCGVAVDAVEGAGKAERVRLSDGAVLTADLVVVGVGAAPETGWLQASSLELADGVVCDRTLATSAPGVYAAGDVARWENPLFGRSMRLEHWTSAAEQGAVAGRNAALPGTDSEYATVPYFWSDWYDSRIQFVGIPDADEVRVVSGAVDQQRFVALYRQGGRLVGALTLNGQSEVMKYRRLIGAPTSWPDALDFAAQRERRAA